LFQKEERKKKNTKTPTSATEKHPCLNNDLTMAGN